MEINNIYIVYREEYPFSLEEVREISRAVHSGSYVFSPLRLVALPKERANDHFIHKSSIPDLPEIAFVCIPSSDGCSRLNDSRTFLGKILISSNHFLASNYSFRKEGEKLSF